MSMKQQCSRPFGNFILNQYHVMTVVCFRAQKAAKVTAVIGAQVIQMTWRSRILLITRQDSQYHLGRFIEGIGCVKFS